MKKILIIDYGMGNIQSIINAFKKLNIYTAVSRSKDDILKYNNYILPGVGSFGEAMKKINKFLKNRYKLAKRYDFFFKNHKRKRNQINRKN